MGEEMTFTIILAMMFGATVGAAVMAGFNNHSYDKGYNTGHVHGHKLGFIRGERKGFEEGKECQQKIVTFRKKEVSE